MRLIDELVMVVVIPCLARIGLLLNVVYALVGALTVDRSHRLRIGMLQWGLLDGLG